MELDITYRAVTPLFLGGADPNLQAELRAASVKGALRFWYRCLDPDYARKEPRYFGSTDEGQSPCIIRLKASVVGQAAWDQDRYRRPASEGGFQVGQKNGPIYLGFSLRLRPNDRRAIPAGTPLGMRLLFRPGQESEELRHAWAASLWLLGHLGGLGTRSRRGLGSLELTEWKGWSPETDDLATCAGGDTAEKWRAGLEAGLAKTRERGWFPSRPAQDHPVLNQNASIYLLKQGSTTWEKALNQAGRLLQDYRQRLNPDYTNVKAHLALKHKITAAGVVPAPLRQAPERAAFGLPLTFRFTSLTRNGWTPSITFVGAEHGRQASPLWIRIVHIGNFYHPLFFHLPSGFLSPSERLKDERDDRTAFARPTGAIVGNFLTTQVAPLSLPVLRP